QVAGLLDGRRATIPLLIVASPQVKPDADRMGLAARIEGGGGSVRSGMCFYQSYAREMAEANGWKRLATNSAKLVNIVGGYGYQAALMSMPACIDAACNGGRVLRQGVRSCMPTPYRGARDVIRILPPPLYGKDTSLEG